MQADIYTALTVSVLALMVIFLVLSILIGVIKVLVTLLPYKEKVAPAQTRQPSAQNALAQEHTVAIHAAIASHTGKAPHEIQITNIASI